MDTPVEDTSFYDDTVKPVGAVLAQYHDHRNGSRVAQLGGHSNPQTHRGAGQLPPGAAIVTTLLKSLEENPLFDLRTSSPVSKILLENRKVVGVEYTHSSDTATLHGPVIFASGGFASDAYGMIKQYRPNLAGFPSTNDPRPGSQHLLTIIGAQLHDMDLIQVHPTGFVDPEKPESKLKFLAAERLRGEGGILLLDGKRFVNEMETREVVTDAITAETPSDENPKQWDVQLVFDEGAYNVSKSHMDFYLWKGLMHKTTVAELGAQAIPTLREYADAVAHKREDVLGRKVFGNWTLKDIMVDSMFYVGRVTPVVQNYTKYFANPPYGTNRLNLLTLFASSNLSRSNP
ncbi:Flavocytochrome c [Venturia nashicola]|uniref:Flavocytochrome c n=1 Tax=Venturia nashicola TaxID=86259 RepID=A0A4Z1NVD4_9PEZI|nr:Flavocytochrome c [Venturia nashicola]